MASRMRPDQRERVIALLAQGRDRNEIAATVGLSPAQVSAIAAHVTMGTYDASRAEQPRSVSDSNARTYNSVPSLSLLSRSDDTRGSGGSENSKPVAPFAIPIGSDIESHSEVCWAPLDEQTPNPHMLIIGKSGYGKTYAITGLIAELSRKGIPSVVLDYGQGFLPSTVHPAFSELAHAVYIDASTTGININPLQLFPSDVHGPANVAQRVADTFARVYRRIGVQQHAALRKAVLHLLNDAGIELGRPASWRNRLPPFSALADTFDALQSTTRDAQTRHIESVASHVSTLFVFNTFRPTGQSVDWNRIFGGGGRCYVFQLRGLERMVEQVVTEFLLWNLIGYTESLGPGPLRCFIVLDEAHKLSAEEGSPVERLLREGRKFGTAAILASQQPEDFSPVAFSNTASKLVFQVNDQRDTVAKALYRQTHGGSVERIREIITHLPRGVAFAVTGTDGKVIKVTQFEDRITKWKAKSEKGGNH